MERTFNIITKHIFESATINRAKSRINNVLLFDAANLTEYVLTDLQILETLKDELNLAPLVYGDYDENNKQNIIASLGTIVRIRQAGERLYCDIRVGRGPLRNLLYDMAERPGEYGQVAFNIVFEASLLEKTITHIIEIESVNIAAIESKSIKLFEHHIRQYDEAGGKKLDKMEKELREQAETKLASNILKNAGLPDNELNRRRVRFCDNEQSLYALLKQMRKDLNFADDEEDEEEDGPGPDGLTREERLAAFRGTTARGRTTEEWAKRLKESKRQTLYA